MKKTMLWALQIIVVGILAFTSWSKLSSQPDSILIFSQLGMEPTGRYLIGLVEGTAAVFLLTNRFAAAGGLLAMGTMLGAIIAHATILGFNVLGDHGRHVMLLAVVLICATIVTIARRRQLPLIGSSFID